jgi:hypothetical protein
MKITKKNKIILGFSSLALVMGVTYQNCGQMKHSNPSISPETKQTQSVLLQGLEAGGTKDITITLKDGTKFQGKLTDMQTVNTK